MPTSIVIPDCEYAVFEHVRDAIFKTIFFAVDTYYSPKLQQAVFHFADTKYIPESLYKYMKDIPGNDKLVQKLDEMIKDVV